ncbi:MAG: ribulose-phosphate 3-epimerase [Anaerolineales bacterium]
MKEGYLIAPSILSADFTQLGSQIKEAEQGGADWIHIDVMDGHFVPNLTMGPFIVETCANITSLPLDVHLMVEGPETLLSDFAQAGANILTVHIETCPQVHRTLQTIHDLGCKAGITLNPGTPAGSIDSVLPFVDLVLVMTVNPGYSGQSFIPEMIPKIAHIRGMLDKLNPDAKIEVDGGINPETMPGTIEAGAEVFVAASAVFDHPQGIKSGIAAMRDVLP